MAWLPEAAFRPFGAEHRLLLVLFALGCLGMVLLGHRVQGRPAERVVRRALALVIVAVTVPLQALQLRPSDFDAGTSLPLQICDLDWVVAVVALLTAGHRATWLLYYWGLTLTTQAIATPSLGQDFPDPRFFMFWGMHLLTAWAAVLLAFGLGKGPSWRGYRFALACTAAWAALVSALNALAGTNYGYLNHKPPVHSLLDLLGPWPGYVAVEAVLIAAGWALLTLPWVIRARRREPVAAG
jgi:hypothetical integral membrane protein (TIGR02206 family)